MTHEEILELIAWHEGEATVLVCREIPNVNLERHIRSAAALRHLLQAQTWRPISEAPHGKMILGFVDGCVRLIYYGKTSHVPLYGWNYADQGAENCDLCEEQPTHWMPLPQPPSSFEERGSATPSDQQNEGEA
jgi:hypothetical protein